MKTLIFISALIFSLLLTGCGSGGGATSSQSSSSSSSDFISSDKNLITLYVAGSDLEENSAAASTDFDEIITGYNRLSSSEKENLKILIAFGGARLDNWRGVKYADIACLIQDSKDKKYGNDTCYFYENASANMGSSTTLKELLRFASNDIQESSRNFLIFWNHGGAYDGVCYDSNNKYDQLTLSELEKSLQESSIKKLDVIGMDACLMANIEVIKSLKPYSNFYLASEAVEPNHGWDYEDFIYIIGHGSSDSLSSLGVKFVDSFMDSTKHANTQNKTLSFLDLSKADDVIKKVDDLSRNLDADNDFKGIGLSAYYAQKFAVSNSNNDGMSIDIKSFSQQLALQKDTLKSLTDSLSSAVDKLVIYARGQNRDTYGVSIFQPLDSHDWSKYRLSDYKVSDS
jgi:hypothetical protein